MSKTGTFTPASGITVGSCVIMQTGNNIFVHFSALARTSGSTTGSQVVGVISGVDLPALSPRLYGLNASTNAQADAYISPNGNVTVNIPAVNQNYYMNGSYMVAGGDNIMKLMEYKPVNYPNLWTPNTEIDLGNGLFGYRATGNITAEANAYAVNTLQTGFTGKLISSGGQWTRGQNAGNYYLYSQYTSINNNVNVGGFLEVLTDGKLNLRTMDNQGRTNMPYDVWVTYTK
ncbi:MAG: hypothetical protein Ta2D_11770 [Rickettsiales bacterium]|nr:MAG: hypothetical protein Ta2D_11770 [Rickettsiales bacterium]